MQSLLETNIYEPKGKVLICGACLPKMQPEGYAALAEDFDFVMNLCLEKEHINMAITKICGMLSTGQITQLVFATVNHSPHCTQMHYIKHEIKRTMKQELPPIFNFIVENNELHLIYSDVTKLSRDLVSLQNMVNKSREKKLPNKECSDE